MITKKSLLVACLSLTSGTFPISSKMPPCLTYFGCSQAPLKTNFSFTVTIEILRGEYGSFARYERQMFLVWNPPSSHSAPNAPHYSSKELLRSSAYSYTILPRYSCICRAKISEYHVLPYIHVLAPIITCI